MFVDCLSHPDVEQFDLSNLRTGKQAFMPRDSRKCYILHHENFQQILTDSLDSTAVGDRIQLPIRVEIFLGIFHKKFAFKK